MSHAWRHLKHSFICKSAAPLLFYRLYGNTNTPKRVALFHQGPVDVYVEFCWSICSAGCQAHVNVGTSQNPRALNLLVSMQEPKPAASHGLEPPHYQIPLHCVR